MPSPLTVIRRTRAEIDLIDQSSTGNPNYLYLDQYGVYYEVDPATFKIVRVPRSLGDVIMATLGAGYVVVTNANTVLTTSQVTANELFFVKNARSNIQAQIDALGPTLLTGPAGGDLSGTYPNPVLRDIITTGGPYGGPFAIPVITVDSKGRITSITAVTASGGPPSGAAGGDLAGTYPNPTLVLLADSGVGSFVKITRDTKGRVSGTTAVLSADIISALGYTPYNSTNPAGYITAAAVAAGYVSLSGSYADPSWITSLDWTKITATPTTISGYGITDTTAQLLTGLVAGVNTPLVATDSILIAFQNLQAQISAVISSGVTSVSGTTNRITSTGGTTPVIDISASYVGQASITTLGTITTGTWNATTIAVLHGGTGVTTFGGTNTLLYTSSADTLSSIVTANTSVLVTNGAGVPSWVAQGTAFNLNVGTTAGTLTAGDDPRLSDSRARKLYGYQNTNSTNTGNLTETILCNLLISAGAMGTNGVMMFKALIYALGTAGTKTFKAYLGPTSNSLVGAVQIGQALLTATQLSGGFQREMANKNSASLNNVYPATTNNPNDQTNQTVAFTVTNINTAVDQYLMVTGQLANTGDTVAINNIQLYISLP